MYLTLSQAAKETGKSKGTLSKALHKGTLSYVEKTDAGYKLDPAEVFRVFPKKPQGNPKNEQIETHKNPIGNSLLEQELQLMKKEIEFLKQRTTDKDEQIQDLQKDRDHWRQQATHLIEDKTKTSNKGLLKRLFR